MRMKSPLRLFAVLSVLSAPAHAASGENWHAAASFEAAKTAASADKTWFFSKPVVSPERRAEIQTMSIPDLKARAKIMLDSLPPQYAGQAYYDVDHWAKYVWNLALESETLREGSRERCYQAVTKDSTQPYLRMIERVKACTDLHDLRLKTIYGNLIPRVIEDEDSHEEFRHPSGRKMSELSQGWAIVLTVDEGEVLWRELADLTGLSDRELEKHLGRRWN